MPRASLVFCLVAAASAAPAPGNPTDSLRQAIACCYRQQYDSSRAVAAALAHNHPLDPAPVYWQAALCQMLIYDSGNRALADSFNRLCSRTIALCRSRLAAVPGDAAAQFYWGMTLLNTANLQAWQQNKLAAASTFTGAPKHLRAAAQLAPSNPDFGYGVGMVDYFQSFFGKLFGKKPGAGAFRRLRTAAECGTLSRESARYTLAWMLGAEGQHDEAIAECRRLLGQYPGNRSAMRLLRDNLLESGQCREMLGVADELEQSIRAAYPNNRYGLAENRLKMAVACERLGRRDSALALARGIIEQEPLAPGVPWLGSYVREAKEIVRRLDR